MFSAVNTPASSCRPGFHFPLQPRIVRVCLYYYCPASRNLGPSIRQAWNVLFYTVHPDPSKYSICGGGTRTASWTECFLYLGADWLCARNAQTRQSQSTEQGLKSSWRKKRVSEQIPRIRVSGEFGSTSALRVSMYQPVSTGT